MHWTVKMFRLKKMFKLL